MATIVGTAMLEYEETEWVLACVSGAGQGFERHNTLRRQSVCSYNKVRLDMFINHLKENYNPYDLIDKLDISIDDLLVELDDYIMNNLHIFVEDLEQLGICSKETDNDD